MKYLYRRGDGNEGNFPRAIIEIPDGIDPFAALHAAVVTEYIPGKSVRRCLMREGQTDGEAAHGIYFTLYEGPRGERAFDAAYITAEFQPITDAEIARCRNLTEYTIKQWCDRAAWRFYRRIARV